MAMTQKGFTKTQALKLKAGDVVLIQWNDSEPTRAVLIERMPQKRQHTSLKVIHENSKFRASIEYDQVVQVLGNVFDLIPGV